MAKKKQQITVAQQLDLFNFDVNKFENFNATVNELRTGIYAPIEKISTNSITFKKFVQNKKRRSILSSWGEVHVLGNILTQTHRDLLDCILSVSEQPVALNDGRVAYYFKLSDVSKEYSQNSKNNYTWIKDKLQEMQTTAVEFKAKDSTSFVSFNILEKIAFSESHDSYGIVFSSDYRQYVEQSLTVSYQLELPKLLKVDSALLKAIVRFFWTHKHCNISIDQVLTSIGYPVESDRAVRSAKKEIRDNSEVLEKEFGIFYNKKENFLYTQINENIDFIPPTSITTLKLEE
jgi:hypothetical protein